MAPADNDESFTEARDELIPRSRRRFVRRDEFAELSKTAAAVDLEQFRADQDAAVDSSLHDPMSGEPG